MTSTPPQQPAPPLGSPPGRHAIDVRGNQNVVVTGDVQGNITVTIGGRDVREQELAYLGWVVRQYEDWAARYTPLAGIVEVRAAVVNGPRLDLPMHFMPTGFEKLVEHGYGEQRQTERVPVDDLRTAIADYRRLVLLGEPGSGKTTTLRRLAFEYADAALSDARAPLPVYVPLGDYAGPEPALAHIQTAFGALASDLPAYLSSGRVVLLLDGLNEMPHAGYAERVGRIQKLLDLYADPVVVVTCRALDYVEKLRLTKLEIKPLGPERQRAYLHRYLGEENGEKLFWQLCGQEIAALWRTWQQGGATWEQFWLGTDMPKPVYDLTNDYLNNLWRLSGRDGLPPLLALGTNPYMLVMLAQVFAAGDGILPQNRGDLFAAFVDTLLTREQKRSEPARWPGIEQLGSAMTNLAYSMQVAGERGTAVDRTWATARMADVCEPTLALYFCASANLLDISDSLVRFVHQLVQEYFAALALAGKLQKGDDLRQYWPEEWTQPSGWEETFILLAGMLLPDMTPLIEALLKVNPALAARCVAESGGEQPGEGTIRRVQETLVRIATSYQAPVSQRNAAGDALNFIGDPRRGVGVGPDGVPDIVWCDVPAGEFLMGNTKKTYPEAYDSEMPQQRLSLARFEVAKYPITNAQYDAFVADGGYTARWHECWTAAGWRRKGNRAEPEKYGGVFDLPNHPVVMITWYEAIAFSNWLGKKLGVQAHLPSEEQWERAARHIDGRRYPWGDEPTPDHANYVETSIGTTTPVGIFPQGAAECGALDMSGNVWEWCMTKQRSNNGTVHDSNVHGDTDRVIRGGSFEDFSRGIACTFRGRDVPGNYGGSIGFRVVIASPPHS